MTKFFGCVCCSCLRTTFVGGRGRERLRFFAREEDHVELLLKKIDDEDTIPHSVGRFL